MPASPPRAPETQALFQWLNNALPQTQCTRCGFPDCASYASAMAEGQAPINQCPPGGQAGIERLAALTGQPVQPLNPAHGVEGPRHVAIIDGRLGALVARCASRLARPMRYWVPTK